MTTVSPSSISLADLQTEIEAAWEARDAVSTATTGPVRTAVDEALLLLDNGKARVELGEGIFAPCPLPTAVVEEEAAPANIGAVDLSAFSSLLKAKWQGAAPAASAKPKSETPAPGQIRSFRIAKLDREAKQLELELA